MVEPKKDYKIDGRDIATVFTDASFCNREKLSGYGVWAKSGDGRGETFGGFYIGTPSVNVAELLASMAGIKHCLAEGIIIRGNAIILKTDSLHVVNFINGDIKVNCPVHAQSSYSLNLVLEKHDLLIKAQHVKGHSKNTHPRFWVNNKCDEIARQQMKLARQAFKNQ